MIRPWLSITGLANAPIPLPPKKVSVGGGQGSCLVTQGSFLNKSRTVSLLTSSIVKKWTFLSPSTKINCVPGFFAS